MPLLSTLYLDTNSRKEAHWDSFIPLNNNHGSSERSIFNTRLINECVRTTRFLIITFIGEYKSDSNTQRFEMNKNTFIRMVNISIPFTLYYGLVAAIPTEWKNILNQNNSHLNAPHEDLPSTVSPTLHF